MAENIFYTKFSEISGDRFDPQMVLYKKSTNSFKYDTVALKDLLLSNPMYGANEAGSERTNKNEPRYIRITDIDEFGNLKDGMGVTAKIIENKYFLNEDDLLFARSGATVGKAYIHRKKDYDCFFAGYMIKFVVDTNKINPYFIFLYTQLDIYKKWIQAIQRAAGQPNINAEEYKSLPIPIPPTNVQQDIINIIQKAYNLKEQKEQDAQNKLNSIDDYLLNELGIKPFGDKNENLENRVFFRKLSEISGDRFDADYYRNRYYENIHYLNQNKNFKLLALGEISLNIFQGVGQNLTTKKENILLKVKNIINDNKIDFENVEFIEDIPDTKKLINGDIITPFIGEAIKKYKFSVFNQPLNNFNYTVDNNTGVIRLKEKYNPIYVSAFFMSSIGKILIEQLSGGGGIPFLGSNSAKKLLIPIPIINNDIDFEKQNKIANHIQNLRDEAQALKDEAIQIFEGAKKEVEKMILEEENEV